MLNTTKNECTCRNEACAVRAARGLTPFCQMPTPASTRTARDFRSFRTYAEASEAAGPNDRIRSTGGGLTGSPKCFLLTEMK